MFLRVLHRGIDKSMEQSGSVTRLPSRGSSKIQKQTFESKCESSLSKHFLRESLLREGGGGGGWRLFGGLGLDLDVFEGVAQGH